MSYTITKATPALTRLYNRARRCYAQHDVDSLVEKESAFDTLAELVKDSLRTGYQPTMHTLPADRSKEEGFRAARCERVADAYDAAMTAAGSPIRAYRDTEFVIPQDPDTTGS